MGKGHAQSTPTGPNRPNTFESQEKESTSSLVTHHVRRNIRSRLRRLYQAFEARSVWATCV
jgi:hypothetical protein